MSFVGNMVGDGVVLNFGVLALMNVRSIGSLQLFSGLLYWGLSWL